MQIGVSLKFQFQFLENLFTISGQKPYLLTAKSSKDKTARGNYMTNRIQIEGYFYRIRL